MATEPEAIGPTRVAVMDVEKIIKERGLVPVTSQNIHEPSSAILHDDGLFSESIFGSIGSEDRLVKIGYIDVKLPIFSPSYYEALIKSNSLYDGIISGQKYAQFDENIKDFISVSGDPEGLDVDCNTGFQFFVSRLNDIQFNSSNATTAKNRVKFLEKYRDLALTRYVTVLPAGLRELEEKNGRMSSDDINKLYSALIALSRAMDENAVSGEYFDPVRYMIQTKVFDIYKYISNIVTGKTGYLQRGGYGGRNVALGTRNVITAARYEMSDPDDIRSIKPNETLTGIYQTAKGLQPIVSYHLRTIFFEPILGSGEGSKVALTDPETLELKYVDVLPSEKDKFLTSSSVERWISLFKNTDVRFNPIVVKDDEGKEHNLCMVFDEGDRISLFRSRADLDAALGGEVDLSKGDVRPLTWAEAMYFATYLASKDRYCMITRYPVIEDGSAYPSKIHLISTDPSRVVKVRDLITGTESENVPHYPVIRKGAQFLDSTVVHTGSLPGLGADHDGDTVSCTFLMSKEANEECAAYFKQAQSVITPERRFMQGASSTLVKMVCMAMSRDPA